MEGRTQDVIAPTSEKVSGIYDDSTGLQKLYSRVSHVVAPRRTERREKALTIGGAGVNSFVVGC